MAVKMYVQVKAQDSGHYKTILILDQKPLADFIAKQKGGRAISHTALQRSEGLPGLRRAIEEATSNPMPAEEFEKYHNKFLETKVEEVKDFVVKLPGRYHKAVKEAATASSTSMNKWIIAAIKRQLKEQKML